MCLVVATFINGNISIFIIVKNKLTSCSAFNLTPKLLNKTQSNPLIYFHILALDIDECINENGGCSQICVNKPGSYSCECKSGYVLSEDKKTCKGK